MVAAADESPAPHRKRTTDSQRGEEKKKKTRKRNKNNETPIHHGFKVRASFVFEKKKKIAKNAVCVLGQVGHQQRWIRSHAGRWRSKGWKRIISLSSILISRSLGLYLAVNLFGNVPFGSCFHAVYTHEQRGVCVCNSTRLQVSQSNQGPHFFFLFSFHVWKQQQKNSRFVCEEVGQTIAKERGGTPSKYCVFFLCVSMCVCV